MQAGTALAGYRVITSTQNMGSFCMMLDDSSDRLLLRCALAASTPSSVQLSSCQQMRRAQAQRQMLCRVGYNNSTFRGYNLTFACC
jgi:hypothetical protein